MNSPNLDTDELYSDDVVGLKRKIIMDMLGAILDTKNPHPNPELWKLHIDAALDQLDESVYKPYVTQECIRARITELRLLGENSGYWDYASDRIAELTKSLERGE